MAPPGKRPIFGWILGAGLFLALALALQLTFGWRQLLLPWARIPPLDIALALILVVTSYAVRTVRVHRYFQADTRGSFPRTFRLILLHNLFNNLLPMRSGEASFPILMKREFGVGFTRSVAGLVYLRILDLHFLVVLGSAVLLMHHPPWVWLAPVALAPLPFLAFLFQRRLERWIERHGAERHVAGPNGAGPNGSEPDGSESDGGAPEGGESDRGESDGGAPEGGESDGGGSDGGAPERGESDGGAPERGESDRGGSDGAAPKRGESDGGGSDRERGAVGRLAAKGLSGFPGHAALFWETSAWTGVNWVVKLLVFAWILRAFAPVPFATALLGSATGELSSVLPFHGLAGAGTYEAGILAGLVPLGVGLDVALPGAVNLHLFVLGASVLSGLLAVVMPVGPRSLRESGDGGRVPTA